MTNKMWTIKRCLDWTREYLGQRGDERARLSAEWLLSSVTGMSRTELYMSFDKPMDPRELDAMHAAVVRRAKGEPLQYIAGETTFRMIDVACEEGVLIPRPETELLVEEVLTYIDREVLGGAVASRARIELPWNSEVQAAREAEEKEAAADAAASDSVVEEVEGSSGEGAVARVLEVGCGTGCISLSIASERRDCVAVVATDIEPRAVDLAARNRDALGIDAKTVDIRLGNLVSPLDRETEWGTFDVLVSNPPYIPTDVMATLPHEVADFEPSLALDGGTDGLDIFRRLVSAAPFMLRKNGLLACELYEGHLDAAADLCRAAGMEDVRIVDDLTGRPRIVLARVVTPKSPNELGISDR